jgi:hypothetical protein
MGPRWGPVYQLFSYFTVGTNMLKQDGAPHGRKGAAYVIGTASGDNRYFVIFNKGPFCSAIGWAQPAAKPIL